LILGRKTSQRLHTTEDAPQSLASITNRPSIVAMRVVLDVCDDAMRGNSKHPSPRDTRTRQCCVLEAGRIDAAEEDLLCIEWEPRGVLRKALRNVRGGDLALTISQHKHAGREGQAQGPAVCVSYGMEQSLTSDELEDGDDAIRDISEEIECKMQAAAISSLAQESVRRMVKVRRCRCRWGAKIIWREPWASLAVDQAIRWALLQ
jgi:hypothetical protein